MQVVSGPTGKERVHFKAPATKRLDPEMGIFLDWFNENTEGDWVEKAELAHLWFVTIHPFEDSNGRIARAIADMAPRAIRTKFATVLQHVRPESARACGLLRHSGADAESDDGHHAVGGLVFAGFCKIWGVPSTEQKLPSGLY
jgi:fido (protein-threonine AMPylation protein)